MKSIATIILTIILLFPGKESNASLDDLYNSYLESMFSFKFNYTRKILYTLKQDHSDEIKTKLAFANFYLLMYETSGEEEKYHVLCKKEAGSVIKMLSNKEQLTNDDVFHLISAKSMILKIQFMKKNYLRAAGELKNIVKQFEYALDHNKNIKMRLISGMYNYYFVLAKEEYPIIYPLIMFYPSGNKEKGLQQLKESTKVEENNISIRSLLYLARIYDRDEKNIILSSYYYKKLLNSYPDNLFWRYEYIKALNHSDQKEKIEKQKQILTDKVSESKHLSNEQKLFFLNF